MNTFVNAATSMKATENGANAFNTTSNSLINFFGLIGAMRNREVEDKIDLFEAAMQKDKLLATKIVFHTRNIRGGLGERETFRQLIRHMALNYPEIMKQNLGNVPFYGRWDDLYALIQTPVEEDMWDMITDQLIEDITNMKNEKSVSIMAKWLKSINASSVETKRLGRITAKALGLSEVEYRKTLSTLRQYLHVLERKMSANEWEDIVFSQVPSQAMRKYSNAFKLHTPDLFDNFMTKVEKGEEKINAGTLYPYELVEQYMSRWGDINSMVSNVVEAQWKALPNYVTEPANVLVMADTSGSMSGRPMATSMGLATYFAERNTGDFKDMFLTFSSNPQFVKLKGNTLHEKLKNIRHIVDSTNLEAAFELVLHTAVAAKVPAADMPKSLIVISDMEIDYFAYDIECWDFLSEMKRRFNNYGYELPAIVMWNVNARQNTFLSKLNLPNVQFVSGSSPSIFKGIVDNIGKSAEELMLQVLNAPMYDRITV